MTDFPDWVRNTPSTPAIHNEPPQNYQWQNLTSDQLASLRKNLVDSIIQVVVSLVRGILLPGDPGTQLQDWAEDVPGFDQLISIFGGSGSGSTGFGNVIADFLGILGDPSGLGSGTPTLPGVNSIPLLNVLSNLLVNGGQPLNVLNLFGQLPNELFGIIPASAIGSGNPNLLNNGGFDGSISMDGSGVWTWDAAVGHTTTGAASTTANGTLKALLSNAVDVEPSQVLAPSVWVKSSSYAGSGTPIRLGVRTYLAGAAVSTTNVTSVAGPGGTWTQVTGSYTVPSSGVDQVRLRLVVDTTATGGTVWFDDASLTKPGAGPFDAIFGALTDGAPIVNLIPDLFRALSEIPNGNVLGIGGPANVGSTFQETWDQLISGLVDEIGSGAGLTDLFNIGRDVSSRATQGQMSFDILGIRSNKPLNSGFLPTSISNVGLDKVALAAVAPTVPVTKTTALMTYHRIQESMDLGAVSWQGYGTTNITNAYVQIFKMDTTTGVNTLLHTSADIVGSLSGGSSPVPVVYSLPSAITGLLPGDVVGVEINVRGTGTHNVAGASTWLADQAVYPRRYSSVRDSSTTLSPSSFTPTYSSNVPFVEIAVSAGSVAIPHSPATTLLNTAGTSSVPIPSWANFIDVIAVGAGGGGRGTVTFVNGVGGSAGAWAATTLAIGVDVTGASLSCTVGAGGAGGSGGAGSNGSASTATGTGWTGFSAAGGAAGATSGSSVGASPGPETYNSVTYAGGLAQNTLQANGNAAGGGGAGGSAAAVPVGVGGNGAPGAIWIVFRQS